MTTCMNQVGDQAECNFTCKESTKVADKVTAPAPKPKAETTKLCGYCKSPLELVSVVQMVEKMLEESVVQAMIVKKEVLTYHLLQLKNH